MNAYGASGSARAAPAQKHGASKKTSADVRIIKNIQACCNILHISISPAQISTYTTHMHSNKHHVRTAMDNREVVQKHQPLQHRAADVRNLFFAQRAVCQVNHICVHKQV